MMRTSTGLNNPINLATAYYLRHDMMGSPESNPGLSCVETYSSGDLESGREPMILFLDYLKIIKADERKASYNICSTISAF